MKRRCLYGVCLLLMAGCVFALNAGETSEQIRKQSAFAGGLIVQVGCGEGTLAAELGAGANCVVQGLDTDADNVRKARRYIRSRGLYGRVSVREWDGKQLPYADELVNLLVVPNAECRVPNGEIERVLAPRGVALVRPQSAILLPQSEVDGEWRTYRKPVPDDIDDWTHYLYDASGNAVSKDNRVGPPRRLQWEAGPRWSRSHETDMSMSGAVSSDGRVVYFIDEGPIGIHESPEKTRRLPDKYVLAARDAFSGILLWKRPVPDWGSKAWDRERWKWTNRDELWSAPLTLPKRLVAVGDRIYVTLGYHAPLSELDAVTGKTIREVAESRNTKEVIDTDGVLVLRVDNVSAKAEEDSDELIVAVRARENKLLWKKPAGSVLDLTLAASGNRVCYHTDKEVVALDLETGEEAWRASDPKSRTRLTSLLIAGDAVVVGSAKQTRVLSLADGKPLWKTEVGKDSFRGPPDLFAIEGVLWIGTLTTTGYDIKTGAQVRAIDIPQLFTPGHHARCYRAKATENYLLWSKRGVEFLDLHSDHHSRNDWLRGTCRYGLMPANGLLYAPPHPCFCFPGVKVNGYLALSADAPPPLEPSTTLEKGPAYGNAPSPARQSALGTRQSDDWPAYRHDNQRSGRAGCTVPPGLKKRWALELGGQLTPPVMAAGRIYVSRKDTHSVHCLSADDGKELWQYTAGAAIDSPPTIAEENLLFGCADGWVYCLRASDGAPAWRFRAAPNDRQTVSYGKVQSAWPVHGSVLVRNGIAYVAAGRSSFLDGGIFLYGLDVKSGAIVHGARMDGPWEDATKKSPHGAHWMDGGKNDILVGDHDKLYMLQNVFDLQLKQLEAPVIAPHGARKMERHLVASGGFLDDTGFDRLYWMYANRWPGLYYAHTTSKSGQILVFDDETTYGLHTFTRKFSRSPYFAPGREGHELFADDNDNEPVLPEKVARNERAGYVRAKPPKWTVKVPVRARGMVLAGKTLFFAGPPDVVPKDDPLLNIEERGSGVLWAVSTEDGKKLAELNLESPPVFDGLIAAHGCLYMSTVRGDVVCLGE